MAVVQARREPLSLLDVCAAMRGTPARSWAKGFKVIDQSRGNWTDRRSQDDHQKGYA
jgi:hypothetical protein